MFIFPLLAASCITVAYGQQADRVLPKHDGTSVKPHLAMFVK